MVKRKDQGEIKNREIVGLHQWLKENIAEYWPGFGNTREGMEKAGRLLDVVDPLGLAELGDEGVRAARRGDVETLGVLAATAILPAAARRQALKTIRKGGVKASHVSRHDFDKFSADFLGTGEGSQPGYEHYIAEHGPGLYLGTKPETRKGYVDIMKEPQFVHKAAKKPVPMEEISKSMFEYGTWKNAPGMGLEDSNYVWNEEANQYDKIPHNWKLQHSITSALTSKAFPKKFKKPPHASQSLWDELNEWIDRNYQVDIPKGHIYDVELDVDPQDVPILRQHWRWQPKRAKRKMEPLLDQLYSPESERFVDLAKEPEADEALKRLRETVGAKPFEPQHVAQVLYDSPGVPFNEEMPEASIGTTAWGPTAEEAYRKAQKNVRRGIENDPMREILNWFGHGKQETRKRLVDSGINALRYRPQNVGEGMNYVVFNPEIIKILKKTPWALAGLGLGAGTIDRVLEEMAKNGSDQKPKRSY